MCVPILLARPNRWLAALLLATCCGCGGPSLVPVEGMVTLDNQPLSGAAITLQRADGPIDQRVYVAEADSSGHFAARSLAGGAAGAMPGEYTVSISTVRVPPDANELTPLPKERVPPRWRGGHEMLTVPQGGITNVEFAISSR